MPAVLAVVAVVGCQPVDELAPRRDASEATVTETPLDAPVRGMPSTVAALLARAEPEARAWQDEPVLAEILIGLGPRDRWRQAELTWIAAHADRQLTVTVTDEEVHDELTTLAALQLRPVSRRGVAAIPAFPGDAMEPGELAEAARAALRACRVTGSPQAVLYASGAPVSWNGRRWTVPPQWTATVTTSGGAVQLDPVTGARLGCVEGGA